MPNVSRIIKSFNNKTLKNTESSINEEEQLCSCRDKTSCPLQNKCLQRCIVYEATLKTGNEVFTYIGISEPPFKTRFYNHMNAFLYDKHRNNTELSKKVWELKDRNKTFEIAWKVAKKAAPYRIGGGKCDLCLTEKLLIATNESQNLLNKRSELISKCRHINKFLLKNVKVV